ncbi:phospho-N-acetylmuramoyl-pentapeptide-transferase [Bacillus sp. Marseille-Q3570]|uniref:phospho-N-acetylmuramoyl-pentapeptide- transferase n=1 Tax=Bacillus sp. Marseille-Q3570 TaxID=2963522 RepID=UPI0021B75D4D|nr:phospho-N-acetylmuramoyl-pentapeptide-transferase [Bacillus sp. Marseille-Q3570]
MDTALIVTLLASFFVAVVLSPIFIPFLKRLKFGQSIREEGPKSHLKKSGTPTMGGIVIIVSLIITTLVISWYSGLLTLETMILLFVTLGYGIIGFIDDFIKVVMKRNLGLTSKQKLLGQLVIAIIFYFGMKVAGISTALAVPGTEWSIELGWFYFILIIVMLVGASNAVNLTDGLDGLLAGTAAIAFGAFAVVATSNFELSIALFCLAVVGSLLGFLVFNAHPAKVFMGDTGSLALGGAIAAVAILTKMELLLVLIGGVFVMETLSVMIQVVSFKATGRRIFKMSPLHHHYELSGWSEWRIVVTFWAAGLLLAAIGVYIEVLI